MPKKSTKELAPRLCGRRMTLKKGVGPGCYEARFGGLTAKILDGEDPDKKTCLWVIDAWTQQAVITGSARTREDAVRRLEKLLTQVAESVRCVPGGEP